MSNTPAKPKRVRVINVMDAHSDQPVFAVHARTLAEAEQRVAVIRTSFRLAAWVRNLGEHYLQLQDDDLPILVPFFADGYFEMLDSAFGSTSTH